MKVLRSVSAGHSRAPGADAREGVLGVRRAAHALEHRGTAVLEGNVQVRQHAPFCHERDDLIDVRIGVDVVQAHPHAELTQAAREIDEARLVV